MSEPTTVMCHIAERHTQEAMAAIGRELLKGAMGWRSSDPMDIIRAAMLAALSDFAARSRISG